MKVRNLWPSRCFGLPAVLGEADGTHMPIICGAKSVSQVSQESFAEWIWDSAEKGVGKGRYFIVPLLGFAVLRQKSTKKPCSPSSQVLCAKDVAHARDEKSHRMQGLEEAQVGNPPEEQFYSIYPIALY